MSNEYEESNPYGTYETNGELKPYELINRMKSWDKEIRLTVSKVTSDVDGVTQKQAQILMDMDSINLSVLAMDTRLGLAEAEIDIQAGQIVLKASQALVNAIEERVTSAEIQVDGLNAAIVLKADAAIVTDIGTRLSSAEVDIDGLNAQIVLKAEAAIVTDLGTRLSSAEVDIDGLQGAITLRVTKAEFEALEIGGRNLIVASEVELQKYVKETDGTLGGSINHNATGYIPVLPNTTYILSSPLLHQVRFVNYATSKVFISGVLYSGGQGSSLVYITPPNTYFLRISVDINSGSPMSVTKFEKGNKATDWTPAPEDVDGKIDGLETRVASAELKITPEAITSTVTSSTTYTDDLGALDTKIDGIEIGGRNLLKNSGIPLTTTAYLMGKYYYGDSELIEGVEYTITMKYTVGTDRDGIGVYSSGGYRSLRTLLEADKDINGIASKTFTMSYVAGRTPNEGFNYLSFYQLPSGGSSASTIEWVKVEKGNKATDWTPAPEDIETRMETAESSITQNATSITSKVAKTDYTGNTLVSMINQTSSEIQLLAGKVIAGSPNMIYDVDSFEQYAGKEPMGSFSVSTNIVTDEQAFHGRYSLKHVSTGASSYKYLNPTANNNAGWLRLQNGKQYIVSAYVKTTSTVDTTIHLSAVAREYGSTTTSGTGGTSILTLKNTDGWKRISVLTGVISGTNPAMTLYVRNVSSGITTYWDAIQVEEYNGLDSTPSQFTAGGQVTIDGGNITATSITANQIKSLAGLDVNGQFIVDVNGNVTFKGNLSGANGTFNGSTTSTNSSSGHKVTIDNGQIRIAPSGINERTVLDYNSRYIDMYTQNGKVEWYSKAYVHKVPIYIPAATYSVNNNVEVLLSLYDYTGVAINNLLGIWFESEAREWFGYERTDGRVYGSGDLQKVVVRVSPLTAHTSAARTIYVNMLILGTR